MRRIIVCGSRDYTEPDYMMVYNILAGICHSLYAEPTIVEGGAAGADRLAREAAESLGLESETYYADWNKYGKAAGHIRNRDMLNLGADMVLAFKDNFDWSFSRGGTENMVRIAKEAGVPAYVIQRA